MKFENSLKETESISNQFMRNSIGYKFAYYKSNKPVVS